MNASECMGFRGLRVVDASIMPLRIGVYIQATVYAIVEKSSENIELIRSQGSTR